MSDIVIWEDPDKIQEIRKIFAPTATETEFMMFVAIGKATGLSPFLREIWITKYGNRAQIFIGRDGYRKNAQRQESYDYHIVDAVYSNDNFMVEHGEVKHIYSLKDRGELVGAYCVVKKKGASGAPYTFVELREYNTKQSVWSDKPATMIKKVAEAQALRSAYQEIYAGTYHEAEDWMSEKPPIFDLDDKKTIDVSSDTSSKSSPSIKLPTAMTESTKRILYNKIKERIPVEVLHAEIGKMVMAKNPPITQFEKEIDNAFHEIEKNQKSQSS